MNAGTPSPPSPHAAESTLDLTGFVDHIRAELIDQLDPAELAASSTLQRVVDLAAVLAGSKFAQISLISDVQYVPAAHGCAPSPFKGTAKDDSLCSVTMAGGRSMIIDDTTAHPLVRDLPPVTSGEVGSYLGIPLRTRHGELLGALCVYDDHSRTWPDQLAGALEDLALFAATEIEQIARINAQTRSLHELTDMIQRIVAPAPSAMPHGVEIIGRYLSSNVGGDWYEWTPLGSEIAITLGDVAGHGLAAIATMATLKAHVRAYVLEGHDPGQTLALVSRAFAKSGEMATVLDARYRPADRLFTYASAGHPPPLILRGGDAFFAELQPGPPIGFGIVEPRTHAMRLERDDTVLICTDGLYEQRRSPLDQSLETLRSTAVAIARTATSLEDLADALLHITLGDTNDDACLIVLRP